MNVRSRLRIAVAFALLATLTACEPATREKLPRIGFLGMDSQMQVHRVAAFRDGLRELGYVEGRTITIDYRWAEGRFDRLPALAAELVALDVDVIVTAAPPAVRAAQQATSKIPIVMSVHDPIGMGFIEKFSQPGGNITGLAFQDSELSSKRLELLRQLVPSLDRVALLWNHEGGGVGSVQAVEATARSLGLQVLLLEIRVPGDFATAIASAQASGAQGVIQLASPFITKHRHLLLDQLASRRMPASCELREYVIEGCLMTYSANLSTIFRRMADFVARILKGARPSELPIEQPREFEFIVNLKTARALGLDVPPSLRLQVTEFIH